MDDVVPIGMYEIILDEKLSQEEPNTSNVIDQVDKAEEVVVAPKIIQTQFKKVVQDEVFETRKPLYDQNQDECTLTLLQMLHHMFR